MGMSKEELNAKTKGVQLLENSRNVSSEFSIYQLYTIIQGVGKQNTRLVGDDDKSLTQSPFNRGAR